MEILSDFNFIPYVDNLYTNHGKISFDSGTLLDIPSEGYYIVPGFIDQHIHGANGSDVMDGTPESIDNIMQANKIVLIAIGKNKQEAIKGLVMGDLTTALPASILQDHINVTIYLDEDAANLLL